jgi:CheY-like chemotaxis protein
MSAAENHMDVPRADFIILLVDDNPTDRELMRLQLAGEPYTILEAESAGQAWNILLEREFKIDLLLTDIHMPGMDGVELAKKALSSSPKLKVLFASGFRHEFNSDVNGHEVHFIEKNQSYEEFSRKVREILSEKERSKGTVRRLWSKLVGTTPTAE